MQYLAFDQRYYSKDKNAIELQSKRRIWISKNDKILLFKRKMNELSFKSYGVVDSGSVKELEKSGYKFEATIREYEEFDEERNLNDFTYSLQKIYRYSNPLLHFRKPYIKLSENDFETLVEARIYWARTAFGLFISKLPNDSLVRFMSRLAVIDSEVLLQRTGYKRAWNLLRKFIEEEYIAIDPLFNKIRETINKINKTYEVDIDFQEIGLVSDEEDDTADSISVQNHVIKEFIDKLSVENNEMDLFDIFYNKVEINHLSEDNFEKIFEGTPWPIQATG